MDKLYKEVDDMFIENYIMNLKKQELDDNNNNDYEEKNEIQKNIIILNKGFQNNKTKNKNEILKIDFGKYLSNDALININFLLDNYKILKTIFQNKRKQLDDNQNRLDYQLLKLKNLEFEKNYLNVEYIMKFISNYQNLHSLMSNQYLQYFNDFVKETKESIRKSNYKCFMKENKNNHIKEIKMIKKIKYNINNYKEELKLSNNHFERIVIKNNKNFNKFKRFYNNNENEIKKNENSNFNDLNFFHNNINSKMPYIFKENLNKELKYNFKEDELKFLFDMQELEKKNFKKVKGLRMIIQEKIDILKNIYINIILSDYNLNFYKNGIINYINEIIEFENYFDFDSLLIKYKKIDIKYIFFRTKMNIIYEKKTNVNKNQTFNRIILKDIIIKKNKNTKETNLNKSVDFRHKRKYFDCKLFERSKKNKIYKINNNIDYKSDEEVFIFNFKLPNLNNNLFDIIKKINHLETNYFIYLKNDYINSLEINDNKYKLQKNIKSKKVFFEKIIKMFGFDNAKSLIQNKYAILTFDFKNFMINNI